MKSWNVFRLALVAAPLLALPGCVRPAAPAAPALPAPDPRRHIFCPGPPGGAPAFVLVRFFAGARPIEGAPFARALRTPAALTVKQQLDGALSVTDPRYNFQCGSLAAFSIDFGGGYSPDPGGTLAWTYAHQGQSMTLVARLPRGRSVYLDSVQFKPGVYVLQLARHPGQPAVCDPVAADVESRESPDHHMTFRRYLQRHGPALARHNPFADVLCIAANGTTVKRADGYIPTCLAAPYAPWRVVAMTEK